MFSFPFFDQSVSNVPQYLTLRGSLRKMQNKQKEIHGYLQADSCFVVQCTEFRSDKVCTEIYRTLLKDHTLARVYF